MRIFHSDLSELLHSVSFMSLFILVSSQISVVKLIAFQYVGAIFWCHNVTRLWFRRWKKDEEKKEKKARQKACLNFSKNPPALVPFYVQWKVLKSFLFVF